MIEFVAPRGAIATEMGLYELSKDISTNEGAGITVALLAMREVWWAGQDHRIYRGSRCYSKDPEAPGTGSAS